MPDFAPTGRSRCAMAMLSHTAAAISTPKMANNPMVLINLIRKTSAADTERYHSRSVHTRENNMKPTISTASTTTVGANAPRRRPGLVESVLLVLDM